MKFIPDAVQGPSITGYGPGWVEVNGEKYHSQHHCEQPRQLFSRGPACASKIWESLTLKSWRTFASELVLFGSGASIRFPHPQWLKPLYSRRIGLETMDTQAACRTYNFLSGEGRKVVAALII